MTQQEMSTLRSFGDEWASGNGDWTVDHLACRGMLERGFQHKAIVTGIQGYVEIGYPGKLTSKSETGNQFEKVERAYMYCYRLTRRGHKALKHAEITG
jgi:hypothetical protein